MDIQAILLSAMADYGAIAVFIAILFASMGLPLPSTFLLVAAGSFISQGEMDYWSVLVAGIAGAILGDHIGYGMGRWGGRSFVQRVGQRFNAAGLIVQAEATMDKWGGPGVFLTRWLLTAVGPYVNITCGIARYNPLWFSIWDIIGEILWVVLYLQLGGFFSDQLAILSDTLGDLVWVMLGLAVIVVLVYKLMQSHRAEESASLSNKAVESL